jgi:uncharacterized protein YjiS (DUF1127 family)
MSGFAIGVASQDAPVSPTQPTIERFGSTSARPALLGGALGASLGQTWRQLRRWIARSSQRHALSELDDRLLRDVGVIRERDIGVSREEARGEIELFWRT